MKFLIVGGGSIGKRHIKNLNTLGFTDNYCLKRTHDTIFESENKVTVVTDISQIKGKVDGVIICTPTSLHNEGLMIAKKLNSAIFMEKPLIHSVEGLNEAQQILKDFNQVFFIGFMLRYHPLVLAIESIIASKRLGNVYSARFEFGSFLPFWHPWEDYKESYASQKQLGGGVINTITHELDLIQFYFGSPLKLTCTKSNFGKLGIDVEEMADAVFEYEDKVVTLHLDYLQKDYDRRIRILCDEGSIMWNWHDQRIEVKKHGEALEFVEIKDFDVNQLYIDELKDFISLIDTQMVSHSLDFSHAISNTTLLLKMHEVADFKH